MFSGRASARKLTFRFRYSGDLMFKPLGLRARRFFFGWLVLFEGLAGWRVGFGWFVLLVVRIGFGYGWLVWFVFWFVFWLWFYVGFGWFLNWFLGGGRKVICTSIFCLTFPI